jgi:hypothetical protein
MRNKMVTLCPTTYEIASKMDNFSGWIRIQLMAFDIGGEELGAAVRARNYWKAQYDELNKQIPPMHQDTSKIEEE